MPKSQKNRTARKKRGGWKPNKSISKRSITKKSITKKSIEKKSIEKK